MAIIVGCAPALRSFWGLYVSKSTVDGTVKDSKAKRDYSHSGNIPLRAGREGSDEFLNNVRQSDAYIRMENR